MTTFKLHNLFKTTALLGTLAVAATASAAEPNVYSGRAAVYKDLDAASLEAVSTPKQIGALFHPDTGAVHASPTRIWKVLEHAEKLECLSCIPAVSTLLYSDNAKNREIGAWWLRRRVFGVFGPGQVYEQTVNTLGDSEQSETHRAYAANALGEFLSASGVPALSTAAVSDGSARVRAAAVAGLERLNSSGANGELTTALGDQDENVRLVALHATTHINAFADVEAVVALVGDPSSLVRRRTAESLGVMKAGDAVAGLIALSSPEQESDPAVRGAAIWALGQIGDSEAKDAILAAQEDADNFVRNAAAIAMRQLRL